MLVGSKALNREEMKPVANDLHDVQAPPKIVLSCSPLNSTLSSLASLSNSPTVLHAFALAICSADKRFTFFPLLVLFMFIVQQYCCRKCATILYLFRFI